MKISKRAIASALVLSMVVPMAGCKKEKKVSFEAIKAKDVINALEDMDCEETGWGGYWGDPFEYYDTNDDHSCFDANSYNYDRVIAGRLEDNTLVVYYEFDDEDDAYDYFTEVIYEEFEDLNDDDGFDGDVLLKESEGFGYVLINAETDDVELIVGDTSYNNDYDFEGYCGGVYYVDNMVLIVMNYDDCDVDEVTEFLDLLEYPFI